MSLVTYARSITGSVNVIGMGKVTGMPSGNGRSGVSVILMPSSLPTNRVE